MTGRPEKDPWIEIAEGLFKISGMIVALVVAPDTRPGLVALAGGIIVIFVAPRGIDALCDRRQKNQGTD